MVLVGDSVPAGTTLVTHGLHVGGGKGITRQYRNPEMRST